MTLEPVAQAWLPHALILGSLLLVILAGQRGLPGLLAASLAVLMGSAIGGFLVGWLLIPGLYWMRRLYPTAIRWWTIPVAIAVAAVVLAQKLVWPLQPPPGPTRPAQAIVKRVDLRRNVYFYNTGKYVSHPHFEELPVPIQVVLLDLTPAGHGPLFARDLVDSGSVADLTPGAAVPVELSTSDAGAARLAGATRSFGWRALVRFLSSTVLWGVFWTLAFAPIALWLRRHVRPVPSGNVALLLAALALPGSNRVEAQQRSDSVTIHLVDVATGRAVAGETVTVESDNGIRCVRAPCPVHPETWKGRADANGAVRLPAAMVQSSTTIHAGRGTGEVDRAARVADGTLRAELFPPEGQDEGPRYIRLMQARTDRPLPGLKAVIEYAPSPGQPARLEVTANALGYVPVPYDVILGADDPFVVAKGFRRTPLDVSVGLHRTLLQPE